ncbi:MAG: hypothetical protein WCY30_03335 [Candidatus Neomarinimicrobiota bacterium]|jgi:hypothetical protein
MSTIHLEWDGLWGYDLPAETKKNEIMKMIEDLETNHPEPNIRKDTILIYLRGVIDGLDNVNIQIILKKIQGVATG